MVMLSSPASTAALEAHGIPVFADPSRAVQAMAALALMARRRRDLYRLPEVVPVGKPLGDVGTEAAAKRVLAAAGLPVLPEELCVSADAATAAADAMGYPVVAKIASPDILHKTEIGGVLLNLADAAAVRAAFALLMERARAHAPAARLEGVLVTPMVKGGVETILGVQVDPTFGPLVLYGAGGTAVELYKDVALASAPLTPDTARALVDRVRSSALLRGWRGAAAGDEAALVDALVRLSDFGLAHAGELESIDVNPLLVRPQGARCLDAVITLRNGQP